MARAKRDAKLDTRNSRRTLRHRKGPYWTVLEQGRGLGYYRPSDGSAGTWIARLHDPETKKHQTKRLGSADDLTEPDGLEVLSFPQAQVKAREWMVASRAMATGDGPHKGPYTVSDAWEHYRKDCIRRGVKRMDRLDSAARLHILPVLGGVEIERLTQTRIESWHHDLSQEPIRKKPRLGKAVEAPKPTTDDEKRKRKASANRVLTILKSALNFAKQKRRVSCSADIWREAKSFEKVDAPRLRFLTVQEQARLVNACPPDFKRLVQGALFTGGRVGELTRLQVKDLDPKNGSVFFEQTKSGRSRHVFLTKEAQVFFAAMVAGKKAEDRIFTHEAFDGRQWDKPKVEREWKTAEQGRPMRAACKAANVGAMSFHELRHTYASTLINAGVSLPFIAAQLGHSDSRMVEKHYGHLAPSAVAQAIRKLAPKLGIFRPGKVQTLKVKMA